METILPRKEVPTKPGAIQGTGPVVSPEEAGGWRREFKPVPTVFSNSARALPVHVSGSQ
jgi:hypothetical protein